jgi:hypothetical protein
MSRLRIMNIQRLKERWIVRIKNMGMVEQQKLELMEHLVASLDKDELFTLMAKVNDRITYLDTIEVNFRGLYGRAN